MKERKPKDAPGPPDEEDDGLATSEDLFGHLVDAPPPPVTGTKSTRSAPVRVRVSDPVSPEPLTPVEPEAVEPPHAPVLEEAPFRRMRPAAPVDDDEQALALMNDSDLGLTASVWTADRDRAAHMGRRLEVGTVFMNQCDVLDPALPWTGVKDSGKGSTLSALGFNHLTRPRSINFRL